MIVNCFVDASFSKTESGTISTGAVYAVTEKGDSYSAVFEFNNLPTSLIAECFTVKRSIDFINRSIPDVSNINVYTDCKAAITILEKGKLPPGKSNKKFNSVLLKYHTFIIDNKVNLFWIKGHVDLSKIPVNSLKYSRYLNQSIAHNLAFDKLNTLLKNE